MNLELTARRARHRGFTLIDLVIALAVIAILLRIALPSYQAYIVKSSRQAVQGELIALAQAEEKIFLNSNSYTSSVTGAYTGQSSGGLGVTAATSPSGSGKSKDDRYTISVAATPTAGPLFTAFTLTATPKTGTPQVGDGNLTINEQGVRTWGSKTW
jgi:type IV pilus assembly protein PilE